MSRMAELQLDCWRVQHEPVPIRKLSRQAYAAAKLIGHCEAIAGSGLLPEPSEQSLRLLIAEALSAFDMEPHQSAVKAEMERQLIDQ
jgi:hypothetical protein